MKNTFLILIVLLSSASAHAKNFGDACPDLKSCVQAISELTGDRYMFETDIKVQKISTSSNVELTAENANLLFSEYLRKSELARVQSADKLYSITSINNAKGMSLQRIFASSKSDPVFPNTSDLATLVYKLDHPEAAPEIERLVRTYANMGARIYGQATTGLLLMTDNIPSLKSLIPIIHQADVAMKVKPTPLHNGKEKDIKEKSEKSE